ncbi:AfsR family transcriptional regulator [Streptomyces phaeolivaceus]|uniref:AfsR family transcriptional regulator n=1 Tax=Streptomyces phaeolivaceus TaxID=2653200 RepID=A0A5P8KCY1_9ACTN|nr:AfsR/SARP family transcriptional regulator [Streptomyces phaeolivaceus]QFR01002.1 AfsR family transcriptional regulator [Streptomyces phaeolivaceus]
MRFEVLGPLRVCRDDGEELDLGFPQQRALLGLLVVRAGRPVPWGEIVDVLWPERAPASARNVVRRYAGSLRRLLEPGLPPRAPGRRLPRRAGGCLLEADEDEVDLLRFRALTKRGMRAAATGRSEAASAHFLDALGEWRGPVAMGIPAAARVHAVFASVERELIRTTRMAADAALLSGDSEQLLPRLRRSLELAPLDESLHAAHIMALASSGLQAEALTAYERVRRLLAEELAVKPGPELTTAHARVLRQEWAPPGPPPHPSPTTSPARPDAVDRAATRAATRTADRTADRGDSRQLPPDLPVFIGRRSEIGLLAQTTDSAAVPADAPPHTPAQPPASVLICGMPGVGKTALAVHWAHRVADRFPDGQLHVRLRGFDPVRAPLEPAEALRGLLVALGVPSARMPGRTDSLAGLYRSVVTGRRLLLVLDDAADTEQVRPLLPASPGCLTLVTSRRGLSGLIASGTRPLRLDLPSAADASRMLAAHTGPALPAAEPGAAEEIVTRCGRLPLALTLVAARAATHPTLPLAAVAAELRHTRTSLDAFTPTGGTPTAPVGAPAHIPADIPTDPRTAFARSYRRLPPEPARLFRLLSSHPGPDLTPDTAATLLGLPPRRARLLLDDLADAHLVVEHAPGRYTQHTLLRAFATELAERYDSPDTP